MKEEEFHTLLRDYFLGHNAFLEREKMSDIALGIATLATKDADEEEEKKAIAEQRLTVRCMIQSRLERNFDVIYDYTQSPIEKIFLGAIMYISALRGPYHIHFTPPKYRVEDYPAHLRNKHKQIMKKWRAFQEETGKQESGAFLTFVDRLYQTKMISYENMMDINTHIMFYYGYGLYNRYHFMPQPRFDSYKVRKKPIRPDLFIWKPSIPTIKIVVECDGYQYHSNKETFSRDRARDRLLQQNGYQVLRYSGSEINQDPFGKAQELCTYLIKREEEEKNEATEKDVIFYEL